MAVRGDGMKDLIITICTDTRKVKFNRGFIGFNGENLQGNIVVDFKDIGDFVDGTAVFEVEQKGKPYAIAMDKDETNKIYSVPIKSSLLKYACSLKCQVVITQQATEHGNPIFKSEIFNIPCYGAINAIDEIPDEYPVIGLPKVTSADAGKVLTVDENGNWVAEETSSTEDAIPATEKGVAGGVATLGDDGKIPEEQLPEIGGGGTTLTLFTATGTNNDLKLFDAICKNAKNVSQIWSTYWSLPLSFYIRNGFVYVECNHMSYSSTQALCKLVFNFSVIHTSNYKAMYNALFTINGNGEIAYL